MQERTNLKDLDLNGAYINAPFAINNCQLGTTKNGKPFLKGVLSDKTGRAPIRKWTTSQEEFDALPTDGFVWVEGNTQPYQGELQIIVQQITPYEPTDRELAELLPATKENVNAMFAEVMGFLNSLENPAIGALRDRYLEDGDLMDKFCQAPAAQMLHHAFLGGLLEHTRNLMRLADSICPIYPKISRDIVMFGLFLHDLGKCYELTWRKGFGYTTDGQLIGHIVRGAIVLEEKAKACATAEEPVQIPVELLTVLQHIILSHHGEPEYGAAKIPATPEAILINMIDNIDAKMNMTLDVCRAEDQADAESLGGDFTEKMWALNNVRLYRPDPTKS